MSFSVDGDRVAAGGPDDRLLTWDRVKDIAGISRTTAWRMQKVGDFPEPVTISAKRVGWWESELTAWKATRKDNQRSKALAPPRAPRLIQGARSPRGTVGSRPVAPPGSAGPVSTPPAISPAVAKPTAAATVPTAPPVQPSLPLDATGASVARRPKRPKRAVSPDQIDFGF